MTATLASTERPDAAGYFGAYGGRYVPETLMEPLRELEAAYAEARRDPAFGQDLDRLLRDFVGRPTPLTHAERLSERLGLRLYLKREDLCHTGAHKINNALGQALLVKRMGKTRVVAETGAGQHGVATATVCAKLGLECVVYMGTEDMARQAPNLKRMRLLGAEVRGVDTGARTLKDAINEAMRDWITNVGSTHYVLGTVYGPHPFPVMVRDFQSVIGREAKKQILKMEGRIPDALVACVGGGSNAMGLFYEFLDDRTVKMYGVEAGGLGIERGKHAARFAGGSLGVLQGCKTFVLQDDDGQIEMTHSVSAGLDYAAVGPEHAMYHDTGRIEYTYAIDEEAMEAFDLLSRLEGIIPALESAHAVAYCLKLAPTLGKDKVIICNLSGRGDKDVMQVAKIKGVELA